MNPGHHLLSCKVTRVICDRSLIRPSDTVVVAVSGGVDSVALLDYLVSRSDLALSLVVAHLNHMLRGVESDEDEAFVRAMAGRYELPFECRRIDVHLLSKEKGISLEEAGREARYGFFAEIARNRVADSVAIAHHMDDQAETVLLRLLRGSGSTGLRGMAYRSQDGLYIRPFLDLTRTEIEDYVASRKLPFRTDSSNSDPSFLRNRIRSQLLPYLSEYNPSIVRRLADTASIMAADEDLLSMIVAKRWQEVGLCENEQVVLDVASVRGEMPGMRLRLYRYAIEQLKGSLRRISYVHLRDIDLLLMDGAPNAILDLPHGLTVSRSYERLQFSRCRKEVAGEALDLVISAPGVYTLSTGWRVDVEFCSETAPVEKGKMELVVDLTGLPFPWVVRGYRPGDRIVQRGMTGRKKIKDLFIDEKIPLPQRRTIPLFFSGNTLFWVAGIRKAGTCAVDSPDRPKVKVKLLEFGQDPAILP